VDYLSHIITTEGVKLNETKIVAVKEFPKPQSVKEVRTSSELLQKTCTQDGYYL